jgi:hypothetical protein
MNIRTINAIDEIGFDLEKAQMMVSEIQDSYLDGTPCDISNPKDREDLSYKLLLEFQRYSVYASILMDYMSKVEKGLDALTKDLDNNRHETDRLTKNIEKNINDAADLMEAITNGAAAGEMIKNNAEVAHDFLQSALYDFANLSKGPGAHEPSEYEIWEQKNIRKVEVVQ